MALLNQVANAGRLVVDTLDVGIKLPGSILVKGVEKASGTLPHKMVHVAREEYEYVGVQVSHLLYELAGRKHIDVNANLSDVLADGTEGIGKILRNATVVHTGLILLKGQHELRLVEDDSGVADKP